MAAFWVCASCTLHNNINHKVCQACNSNSPSNIVQSSIDQKMNQIDASDDDMIIVMRHSKRIDQHPNFAPHLKWDEKDEYLRPYDPPLCDFNLPIKMTKELETFLPKLNITKIVLSPFLRCIQTAAIIAKYFKIKTFIIDARLGEDALAIKRCIKHAQNKKNQNNKIKYNVPNGLNDVKYLSMDQIKNVIIDLYNKQDNNNNIVNDFSINFDHKEQVGNHLHVECVKEYRNILIKKQKNKQKIVNQTLIRNDTLMISHGQVLSDISEKLSGKIIKPLECGWFCVTHDQCGHIHSPTAIEVLFDMNSIK